jgi:hypothetical protein
MANNPAFPRLSTQQIPVIDYSRALESSTQIQRQPLSICQSSSRHSFVQQIFIEYPLCARRCNISWNIAAIDAKIGSSPPGGLLNVNIISPVMRLTFNTE